MVFKIKKFILLDMINHKDVVYPKKEIKLLWQIGSGASIMKTSLNNEMIDHI